MHSRLSPVWCEYTIETVYKSLFRRQEMWFRKKWQFPIFNYTPPKFVCIQNQIFFCPLSLNAPFSECSWRPFSGQQCDVAKQRTTTAENVQTFNWNVQLVVRWYESICLIFFEWGILCEIRKSFWFAFRAQPEIVLESRLESGVMCAACIFYHRTITSNDFGRWSGDKKKHLCIVVVIPRKP